MKTSHTGARRQAVARPGHIAVSKMMAHLFEGGAGLYELADHSGLCLHTVRAYIRQMRKERVVYICGWDEDSAGRATIPTYCIGRQPDAKRLAPQSRAEAARKWRARRKQRDMIQATAGVMRASRTHTSAPGGQPHSASE